jgi:hypothetical protein
MPSESNRDDLARIIFTAKPEARYQTWEQTSDGIRAWCRAKADDAMAAGWRKVGADQVMVSAKMPFCDLRMNHAIPRRPSMVP